MLVGSLIVSHGCPPPVCLSSSRPLPLCSLRSEWMTDQVAIQAPHDRYELKDVKGKCILLIIIVHPKVKLGWS